MAKLGLHHQGELMLYALRHGYVVVVGDAVRYPGFQRQLKLGDAAADEKPGSAGGIAAHNRLLTATR